MFLIVVEVTLFFYLQTDQVDVRIKAVNLIGKLLLRPEYHLAQRYRALFVEFLKRFSDKSSEVRVTALQCAKACCLANPSGIESLELLSKQFHNKSSLVIVHVALFSLQNLIYMFSIIVS